MEHADHARIITDADRLSYLHSLMLLDAPPEPLFDRLAHLAARLLDTSVGLLTLVDAGRHYFIGAAGLPEPFASTRQADLESAFCRYVVSIGQPLIVEDAREHPLLRNSPAIAALNVVAYLGIPLVVSSGYALGALCVSQDQPREWTGEEIDTLATLAQLAVSEMERRHERTRRENAEAERVRHHELLDQLAEANAELAQALNLTTDIIRIAAHDLRSPLSVVAGFVQLLRLEGDLSPEERTLAFDSLDSAITKMQSIVDNILSLQRVEALAQRATERIDLRDIITNVYHEFVPAAQENRQQLRLFLPDTPVPVYADRAYLAEALTNLVGNAVKYTPQAGEIELHLEIDGDRARFEVRDTGYGIPEDELDRLFIPFSRITTAETEGIEGTGLGLYLVKSAVERFGGQMVVESRYGQGSRFGFTLPLAEPETNVE